MSNKKRRQRGSRTHGGGSHKNRRGAGNRGGRGAAGRDKHEFHNHKPLGKQGFDPPGQTKVETVDIQDIDMEVREIEIGIQDIEAVEGITIAERSTDDRSPITDGGTATSNTYTVNLPEYVNDYNEYDEVKLLDSGKLNHCLNIRTDDCSKSTKQSVKSKGGNIYYTKNGRGFNNGTILEKVISNRYLKNGGENNTKVEKLEEYMEKVDDGETLKFDEFDEVVEIGDSTECYDTAYEIMCKHAENLDEIDGLSVINLMQGRDFAVKYNLDFSNFKSEINSYFSELNPSDDQIKYLGLGLPDSMSVDDVLEGMDGIYDNFNTKHYESQEELREKRVDEEERLYLLAVDRFVDWV